MLISALSHENAALLYEAAELYNAESLKTAAFRFVCEVRGSLTYSHTRCITLHLSWHILCMLSCSAQAVRATAGMDDELLRSLSSALFGLVNADRANRGLPPVTLVHRERDAWTWNDVCKKVTPRTLKKFLSAPVPQCSLPFAYSADRASEWRGRVPKDLLAEACGTGDLRYEPVLSLQNQVGHRANGACSIRAFWMPYRAKVSAHACIGDIWP